MIMRQIEALASNSLQSDLESGNRNYQPLSYNIIVHCHVHNSHILRHMKPFQLK
jgi:hypothetical protein